LRELGIGACGTTRKDVTSPLFGDSLDTWKPEWGTLWSKIDSQKNQDDDIGSGVLVSAWQDSAVVKFATTIHTGKEWINRERKKPRDSSTSAAITKAPFEAFPDDSTHKITIKSSRRRKDYVHRRLLPIPSIVDDYNHFMNGVDIADQLQAKFTTEQQTYRTWLPLFYFCLDTAVVNAYILFMANWNPSTTVKKKIRSTHRSFRETLVEALLIQYKPTPPRRIYINAGELPRARLDKPRRIHQRIKSGSCGKCLFCRFRINMLCTSFGPRGGVSSKMKVQQSRLICRHC
jgi:Transposase IS4